MSRKKQTAKKNINKKGKGIRQQVNPNDGTIVLRDDKRNITIKLPPATSKRQIKEHIKKLKTNITSPNKTKKGFFRKFLKLFGKRSRKKSPPILSRIQKSFDNDREENKTLGITVTKFR